MKVHIRRRKNTAGDKLHLALEMYRGYAMNENGTTTANRTTEKLDYYLYTNPKTPQQKTHNKEVEQKVEIIRAEKEKSLINQQYGFTSGAKTKANFIQYFERLTKERRDSKGNHGNWDSALKHLIKYKGSNISFEAIDVAYCEGFKDYLQSKAKTKSEASLSSNSISSYFNKLRAALNQAVEDDIILVNPCLKVSIPKVIESEREYLTLEEVQALFKAECRYDVLKRAFLFSCLTGLRWSDIQNLEWPQLQKEGEHWKINFHQQKTKGLQYHYINEQARELLGSKNNGSETDRIFVGLKYSSYMNVALTQWCLRAGITKHITFHCGRHTYATLQINLGTDLYTVSKLLGHSEVRTTQIYAKVIDKKKIEAVNIIPRFDE